MSPPRSPQQVAATVDLEKDPLLPASNESESVVDMASKGALNEDHLELRVGQGEHSSRRGSRGARILSRGLKSIAIFLVAFLAANGFWALFRPELFDHNGLISLNGKGEGHHHRHHHHHHHHHGPPPPPPGPPGRGPHHPPGPPPHGPPGHDHPFPPPPPPPTPPPPPHGPPGHDHPFPPPPPPPHKPGHGPGGDRPGPPPPPPHYPHPPPPPPKGPGKVRDCFDLVPGKTLEIRTPLRWFGQGVEVAPSLAGSSVTFVWDGKVGPPAFPPRGPRRGPPHPPRVKEASDDEVKEEKPKKKLGDVVFEIQVPSETEWKEANISWREIKLCSMLRPESVGIHVFNASGIPPSRAHIEPGFDQIASSFNTTVYLPSHFARAPIRTGHLP